MNLVELVTQAMPQGLTRQQLEHAAVFQLGLRLWVGGCQSGKKMRYVGFFHAFLRLGAFIAVPVWQGLTLPVANR